MVMPQVESGVLETTEAAYRHAVLTQSVTMLAYMDHPTRNTSQLSSVPEPRIVLGFSVHDLPILIGAAAGAVGLTIIILVAIIVWHCCRLSGNSEKEYIGNEAGVQVPHSTVVHSGRIYETQVLESNQNSISKSLTRSQSLRLHENNTEIGNVRSKTRPASQHSFCHVPEKTTTHSHVNELGSATLPRILEGANVPALTQCASYDTLEEPLKYNIMHTTDFSLKTRSLPSWNHGRQRPMSTEDDLNELYAKVSFSKKRKNRMGNDSAAAIALTKSRCTTMTLQHEDTDPLVDNEAIVVYDERTAV